MQNGQGRCARHLRSNSRIRQFVRSAVLATVVCVAAGGHMSADERALDVQHSTVTVYVGKTGLFSAFADNHVISAPVASGRISVTAPLRISVIVNAADLTVRDTDLKPGRREEVRSRMLGPEVLDAGRFPEITFESDQIRMDGSDRWDVSGRLTVHGISRDVAFSATRKGNGHYLGDVRILQRDFGIQPIRIAGGTVGVKDEVKVEFDIAP